MDLGFRWQFGAIVQPGKAYNKHFVLKLSVDIFSKFNSTKPPPMIPMDLELPCKALFAEAALVLHSTVSLKHPLFPVRHTSSTTLTSHNLLVGPQTISAHICKVSSEHLREKRPNILKYGQYDQTCACGLDFFLFKFHGHAGHLPGQQTATVKIVSNRLFIPSHVANPTISQVSKFTRLPHGKTCLKKINQRPIAPHD